jgi:hypothetical protein
MTATTLFFGWWGTISFLVTPFFLLNNVSRYLLCLGMPPVAPDATPPRLTEAAIEQIKPYADDLFRRLGADEDLRTVASLIAERAGVTPGQVALFALAVAQSQAHA